MKKILLFFAVLLAQQGHAQIQDALVFLSDKENVAASSEFAIYPNPVSDVLNVSFPKDSVSAQLTVYNVLGTKVLEKKITVNNYSTNVSELTSGMYLAHIQSGHKSKSFKFIKK